MLDRKRLVELFTELGSRVQRPTTLCLIGSTPLIHLGLHSRQTVDIDVWDKASDYDAGELEQACRAVGLLFDPMGDVRQGEVYLQIVRPGPVSLPKTFELDIVARYGKLTIAMPSPAIVAGSKLTRANETDIADIAWLMSHCALRMSDIRAAIRQFPRASDRETALENMVLVGLVSR